MPFTVPWRFCGGGCRLVLGFGAPAGGCCAWSALAATGVAAIQAAKLRRLREGFWFTAYLASLGLESLTVCHFRLLSRICGAILVPGVAPSCDKGQFP